MVVTHVAADFKEAGIALALVVLPGEIATACLCFDETTATAPTAEAAVATAAGVISVAEDGDTPGFIETCQIEIALVEIPSVVAAILGSQTSETITAINVEAPSCAHTFLNGQVKHRLLLAVIDAGDTRIIALTVIGLNIFHHVGLQVLQRHLGVGTEELFLIDEDLLDFLAVDLDRTFLGNFGARELLQQGFEVRAGRHTESVGIIYKGVGFHLHLCQLSRHERILHHLGVVEKRDLAEQHTLVLLREGDVAPDGLVADE